MSEVGVLCQDLEKLRSRCLVSGLRVLDTKEAVRLGYQGEPFRPIAPTEPREPTDQELESIVATPETKRVMQLCTLPKYIGDMAVAMSMQPGFAAAANDPYQFVAPGIYGVSKGIRSDEADQRSTSVNDSTINPITREPAKVGLHIDNWDDPNVTYVVGNLGPGKRYHCVAPAITRERVGRTGSQAVAAYIESIRPQQPTVYWLRLDEPGHDALGRPIIDACVSPVASILHDGSTGGCSRESTAFFYAVEPFEPGIYPSFVS